MFPERAHIAVCLMFALIVDVFESVCAKFRFIFFDLKFKWVNFEASITTSYYLSIVFDFVGSVTLNVSRPMYMICKSCITPLLAIFALRDFRVYICFSNGCNVTFNVETSVDESFSFGSILEVSNVHPYDHHVWFWRSFDNLGTRS